MSFVEKTLEFVQLMRSVTKEDLEEFDRQLEIARLDISDRQVRHARMIQVRKMMAELLVPSEAEPVLRKAAVVPHPHDSYTVGAGVSRCRVGGVEIVLSERTEPLPVEAAVMHNAAEVVEEAVAAHKDAEVVVEKDASEKKAKAAHRPRGRKAELTDEELDEELSRDKAEKAAAKDPTGLNEIRKRLVAACLAKNGRINRTEAMRLAGLKEDAYNSLVRHVWFTVVGELLYITSEARRELA